MHSALKQLILVLTALTLLACSAATDAPARDAEVRRLIAEGKAQLAQNQWSAAKATFLQVLTDYDADNREAHFGIALADTLFISDGLRYLATIAGRSNLEFELFADDESIYLRDLLGEAIQEIRSKFASADTHLTAISNDNRITFRIETLPLYWTDDRASAIDLGGEWDRADALFLRGIARAALGVLDLAASVDLTFDFPRAHAYLTQPGFDADRVEHLLSLLAYLLNDPANPNFLGLQPEGEARMQQAAGNFARAARDWESALYVAAGERDDQTDDILRYVDGNQNGRFDPPFDANADACAAAAGFGNEEDASAVDSFSLLDIELRSSSRQNLLNQRLLCILQKLWVNLAWDGLDEYAGHQAAAQDDRPRLRVIADLLPIVDAAVAGASSIYPQLTFGVPVPEGVITAAVGEIAGDSFELDLQPFFVPDRSGLPATVRALLPAWEKAPCPDTGICANTFAIEMECSPLPVTQASFPTRLAEVFTSLHTTIPVCKRSWIEAGSAQDSSHFGGALAADGIPGYLPYIRFQDPSFHGLLFLNLAATAPVYADSNAAGDRTIAAALQALDADPEGFAAATLADLNAMLAALSSNSTVGGVLLRIAEDY